MAKVRKRKAKTKRKKLTPEQKEQNLQTREIRGLMKNMGFSKVPRVDGKEFIFKDRTSEMDDIFYFENLIFITEYTIGNPGTHLLKKNYIYDLIMNNRVEFLEFLVAHPKFTGFKEIYEGNILKKYTKNQIQVKILYCSKKSINKEHKDLVTTVSYFDFHIVKYFQSLSKVIKRTCKYEFFDFLQIQFDKIGGNIIKSHSQTQQSYSGHILPEENSSFDDGHKIISFYIDASSLLKRAYVLRQNGWKDQANVGHYQRMIRLSKIKSMRKYLHEKKRVFINNIIAAIAIDKIELFDDEGVVIEIDDSGNFVNPDNAKVTPAKIAILDETNIIGIIDGQHRAYCYHEGDDAYEQSIEKFRQIQNLLVTAIIFPKDIAPEKRLKFEAKLFLEINSNQSNASSQLKQEIELMINQFSSISISKKVLKSLNDSGPLAGKIEEFWYEKGKLKTVSIVSYGLRPLLKLEDQKSTDSIYSLWTNTDKSKLKTKESEEYDLLEEYVDFSAVQIRNLMIAFSSQLGKKSWVVDRNNTEAILNVTTVNGILNTLRLLIKNGKVSTVAKYKIKLKNLSSFDFKKYKSSQYRQMGKDIYEEFFG